MFAARWIPPSPLVGGEHLGGHPAPAPTTPNAIGFGFGTLLEADADESLSSIRRIGAGGPERVVSACTEIDQWLRDEKKSYIFMSCSLGTETLHSWVRGTLGVRYQSLMVQFNPVRSGPHRRRGWIMKSRSLGPCETTYIFAVRIRGLWRRRRRNEHHPSHGAHLNPRFGSFIQLSSSIVIKPPPPPKKNPVVLPNPATFYVSIYRILQQDCAKKAFLRQLSTLSA